MSDEDRDVDIESDDDDDGLNTSLGNPGSPDSTAGQFMTQAEKRAHHNALERKRRDHIKDSFHSLRDSVPALHGEKASPQVSRAQILKKAADYIQFMRRKNVSHQQDIDDLKKQNTVLEQQIKALEKAKNTGQYAVQVAGALNPKGGAVSAFDGGSDTDSSDTDAHMQHGRRKKMKTSI